MKRTDRFTDVEREEIRKFAERIAPPSRNVFIVSKKRRKEPGVLNISLDIRDARDGLYLSAGYARLDEFL